MLQLSMTLECCTTYVVQHIIHELTKIIEKEVARIPYSNIVFHLLFHTTDMCHLLGESLEVASLSS